MLDKSILGVSNNSSDEESKAQKKNGGYFLAPRLGANNLLTSPQTSIAKRLQENNQPKSWFSSLKL